MAIFGRNTARHRLRRAAREALKIPGFDSPVDCTPWVTGGLWPAELSTVTAETAPLVKYLKTDLQRIVNSANEELKGIRLAGLPDSTRQAEEARIITEARAFAVRRVESTVRHLRDMTTKSPLELRPLDGAHDVGKTPRFKLAPPRPEADEPVDEPESSQLTPEYTFLEESDSEPDTETFEELLSLPHEIWPPTSHTSEPPPPAPPPVSMFEPVTTPPPRPVEPVVDDTETGRRPVPPAATESEHERMQRLLKFVARQEPGVRWAVGNRADGATVLVTDLAHGWIPPGIRLPADVHLLEPARRKGTAAKLLGETTASVTYAPGDPLGWATDYEVTDTSSQPRDLPPVDDLGWVLSEATHWRDGLPRMVNTLAKAGAAGTGIADAEIDVLRVYLDTSRYQLLAQYPDVDTGLLLNCLLLAATEGVAAKDQIIANYHFAWFQLLSAPPASGWPTGDDRRHS